jgi:hypothetical protein
MVVRVSRRVESRIGRRPFGRGPSVIGARRAVVDFLPRALADVIDEQLAAGWIERERERIPKTERPGVANA